MKFKNPISFLILFLLLSVTCFSQSIVNRANSSYTVQDARFSAQYNLFVPKYTDTTSINAGIDTCGAIVYLYSTNTLWYRSCAGGTKAWVDIGAGAANLIVQNAGSGAQTWFTSGDTLYMKKVKNTTFISASTDTDSSLLISLSATGTPDATTFLRGDNTWATVSAGISSLNALTAPTQTFATGTTGTDFNISSATSTHTFNIPDASATARGLITTGTQTIAGSKTFSGTITTPLTVKAASHIMTNYSTIPSALTTEVSGEILSLGINVDQVGTRDNARVGGIFRFDSRATNQTFNVLAYPAGGAIANYPFTIDLQTMISEFKGKVAIGILPSTSAAKSTPTALLHIGAGTATANTAPLKFTAGVLNTTPATGAVETNPSNELFYSNSTTAASRGYVSLGRYASTATSLTADATQNVIDVTATGQTITLPTAVGIQGRTYTIKLTAAGTGTVATTSSQTIDGSTTYSLSAQYKYVTVMSNNANWIIIGNN